MTYEEAQKKKNQWLKKMTDKIKSAKEHPGHQRSEEVLPYRAKRKQMWPTPVPVLEKLYGYVRQPKLSANLSKSIPVDVWER